MANVFNTIIEMNVKAAVVILFILLIRVLIKNAPKRFSYMLWAVAGFRLCIPYSFKTIFSVFSFGGEKNIGTQITETVERIPNYTPSPAVAVNPSTTIVDGTAIGTPSVDAMQGGEIINSVTESSIDWSVLLMQIAFVIWALGFLGMLTYGIITYVKTYRRMQTKIPLFDNVFLSDKIDTPFSMGIFKPRIYLPFGLSETEQECIIAHEKCHIKRFDHIVKLFSYLLLCVHWFNPMCWIAFNRMTYDMETSCDEMVFASDISEEKKKQYSHTLISIGTKKRFPTPAPINFDGISNTKNRIRNIMKISKTKLWIKIICYALCALVLFACAADVNESIGSDISDDTSSNVSENISAENSESVSTEVSEDISEEVSEDISEDISEDNSSSVSEDVSEEDTTNNPTDKEVTVGPIIMQYGTDAESVDATMFTENVPHAYEAFLFRATETVTNFRFISLNIDYNGNVTPNETIYDFGTLTPENPVIVKTYIDELISERGIQFYDESGVMYTYQISYSMKDGGYYLAKIDNGALIQVGVMDAEDVAISYIDYQHFYDDNNFDIYFKPNYDLTDFRFLVIDDGEVLEVGRSLYWIENFKKDALFTVSTYINDATINRGFAFTDPDGNDRYFAFTIDASGLSDTPFKVIEITHYSNLKTTYAEPEKIAIHFFNAYLNNDIEAAKVLFDSEDNEYLEYFSNNINEDNSIVRGHIVIDGVVVDTDDNLVGLALDIPFTDTRVGFENTDYLFMDLKKIDGKWVITRFDIDA